MNASVEIRFPASVPFMFISTPVILTKTVSHQILQPMEGNTSSHMVDSVAKDTINFMFTRLIFEFSGQGCFFFCPFLHNLVTCQFLPGVSGQFDWHFGDNVKSCGSQPTRTSSDQTWSEHRVCWSIRYQSNSFHNLTGTNLGLSVVVVLKGAQQTALTTFRLLYTAFFRISTFQDVISDTPDVNVNSQRAKAFYIHMHLRAL